MLRVVYVAAENRTVIIPRRDTPGDRVANAEERY